MERGGSVENAPKMPKKTNLKVLRGFFLDFVTAAVFWITFAKIQKKPMRECLTDKARPNPLHFAQLADIDVETWHEWIRGAVSGVQDLDERRTLLMHLQAVLPPRASEVLSKALLDLERTSGVGRPIMRTVSDL